MNFTVKYRGANGAVMTEVLDAASRADVFAQLKARGLAPLSVIEGGTRTASASSALAPCRPAWLKGAVAGLVVVIAAAAVWFFLRPADIPAPKPAPAVKPKVEKPRPPVAARSKRPQTQLHSNVTTVVAVTTNSEFNSEKYPGEKIVSVITNSDHVVEISVKPNGRRTKHIVTPPSIWHSATDGLLEMALNTPENHEMPPLPSMGVGMDQEFLESLKTPIEILPTDDEKTVALKKIVMAAREDVKERLEKGEHFCDIISSHRELKNENGRIRADAMRELHEIEQKGDVEGAKKYRDTMNVALSQMGIAPIGREEGSEPDLNVRQRRKLSNVEGSAK